MSNESVEVMSDIELDDWDDSVETDNVNQVVHSLDSRRLVENKLEDLRLRRETEEFDFGF